MVINMDKDISVIECRNDYDEWEILAYIGPDRAGVVIDEYHEDSSTYSGCDLRIRYLNTDD